MIERISNTTVRGNTLQYSTRIKVLEETFIKSEFENKGCCIQYTGYINSVKYG